MKTKLLSFLFFLISTLSLTAAEKQKINFEYTDALNLTIVGKLFENTPNPYYRIDIDHFGPFTEKELSVIKRTTGMAVSFVTDATCIGVKAEIASSTRMSGMSYISQRGFDLYIKKDGKWKFAGVAGDQKSGLNTVSELVLVENMAEGVKECLLYFPLYSDLNSVYVGVNEGAEIKKGELPFRHRIAVFGSSLMHGCGTSRPGMAIPAQLSRAADLQFLSMAASGCSKLQASFAKVFAECDAEALVVDGFSNGSEKSIRENLFQFIDIIQASKPGMPIIFLETINFAKENFNLSQKKWNDKKRAAADEMMAEALKKYKNIYYIHTSPEDEYMDTTSDGVHPSDLGYKLWMLSMKDQIVEILTKYGIK